MKAWGVIALDAGVRLPTLILVIKPTGGASNMSNNEKAIEQEIQDKGLTAPRLTPALIDATIDSETYTVLPGCLS